MMIECAELIRFVSGSLRITLMFCKMTYWGFRCETFTTSRFQRDNILADMYGK